MKKSTNLTLLFLPIVLSLSAFAQTQKEFSKMLKQSWAYKNSGAVQLFDLNPLQTYRLNARSGEDLGLLPPIASPLATKKIKVAIVDTGVDVNHPYLKNRISYNKAECEVLEKYRACVKNPEEEISSCSEKYLVAGENNSDADGNGYPADCHGWSTLAVENTPGNIVGTPDFTDNMGHGTHVAGLVASISDNIEILPVQVVSDGPNEPVKPFSVDLSPDEGVRGGVNTNRMFETAEYTMRGIIYAINAGADVINLSVGWPQLNDTEQMRQVIAEAQSRGIIIVAAAGNDSTQALLRPCQYAGVICVAAARPDGSLAHFSNYGFGVDIAAPGASILSTIPMSIRSIRLPGFVGIDILSGTSQASPLVAGLVADLLARGVPAQEIYPRLILGARPVKEELPVLVGPKNEKGKSIKPETTYKRYVLSGQADQTGAYSVVPQPLLLLADKEIKKISWDRKATEFSYEFNVKNYWLDVDINSVSIDVKSKNSSSYYPVVTSVEVLNPEADTVWQMGQEKTIRVNLKINTDNRYNILKMPTDLNYIVTTYVNGVKNFSFESRVDVLVKVSKDALGDDITTIPIEGSLERGMKMFLVDEVFDSEISQKDYLALKQGDKNFDLQLIKFKNNRYLFGAKKTVTFSGNIKQTRPVQRLRLDIDFDGISEYVLVIQEFKEQGGLYNRGDYVLHFYVFDEQLNLKEQAEFYDSRALIPLQYSWLKVGNKLRPAWVGMGQAVTKKWNITDLWTVDEDAEPDFGDTDIRLYYLNKDYKLEQVENSKGVRIVDIVQPTLSQVKTGVLPILLARNLGTETKPSYLYSFSLAYVNDLKVVNEKAVMQVDPNQNYRNLLDTRYDRVRNLRSSDDEFRGTYWFGYDTHQRQRVTMIDFAENKVVDKVVNSKNTVFDAPLLVRSAYMGKHQQGVFLITNTEIEYHDFKSGTAAQRSLNKYTYMGDDLTVDLQNPITVNSRVSGNKYPAIFTVDGLGNVRDMKVVLPVFDKSGKVEELVSPARLRLQIPEGCRSLDQPVYLGASTKTQVGGYAIDYYCGDRILRFNLTY